MNEKALSPSPSPLPKGEGKQRILVVEDEGALAALFARTLAGPDREILVAGDARQARQLLLRNKVELVLTDVHLPGDLDGMGLFRWIKGNCHGVEVILMTGVPTLEASLEAFRFGALDYIVKPVDLNHLRRAAERCLQRHRVADELKTEKQLREALEKTYRELSAVDGMRETFRRYLNKEVADKILSSSGPEALKAERRQVSVLFADIRRFTPFAEARTPEETIRALNGVFERLNAVVSRHGGMVSKFTGDGMMALFGAGVPQPDHAARAVACALAMQLAAADWNRDRGEAGEDVLEIGVGVSSGDVVAGNLGSIERSEYTVIGSTVNLAARLEEKASAGQVLIGPATAGAVAGSFALKSQGLVWIDGFSRSLSVFEAQSKGDTEVS